MFWTEVQGLLINCFQLSHGSSWWEYTAVESWLPIRAYPRDGNDLLVDSDIDVASVFQCFRNIKGTKSSEKYQCS